MTVHKRTYRRGGDVRRVTGVQRVGQGRGKVSRVGAVWFHANGGKEQRCTLASFLEWLDNDCDEANT